MRFALGLLLLLAGCVTGQPASQKFVVFFSEWSAALDQPASGTIAAAANWAQAHPGQRVTVSGFAANDSGSSQANTDLSSTRAQVVSDALVKLGVTPDRIARLARGATGYTDAAVESRRVEIAVAQP